MNSLHVCVDPGIVNFASITEGKKYRVIGTCSSLFESNIYSNHFWENQIYHLEDDKGELVAVFASACVVAAQ